MSDTPETDNAQFWTGRVRVDFARRLERELYLQAKKERDEARRERDKARRDLAAANRGAERNAKINQSLCKKLSEAESERDEAKKQASFWEKLALREASANGARLCGKEEVK